MPAPGRRAQRTERGAVAVEAALVTPFLVLLLFGIVELSLLMRDHVALTSAVRVAGRTASANAGAGPGSTAVDCVPPCSPTNAPMLAQLAANAVQRSGSALPEDAIRELWIYRANAKGYPGEEGNTAWTCTTSCVQFKWVPTQDSFRYYQGTWVSSTIAACANSTPPPDSVGIYIKAAHPFITGLFADEMVLEDHAVFAFEPLPTLTCAAGAHL